MLFWVFIVAISLLATLPVCLLFLRSGDVHASSGDVDAALYKARLDEIDVDFQLGRIDQQSLEAAKAEEGRRFLRLAKIGGNQVLRSRTGMATAVTLALLILATPIAALGIYGKLGSPEAAFPRPELTFANGKSFDENLKIAEARLAEHPDEIQGWQALAPVYMRMGRFDDAQNAISNIIRLEGERPELLLALAEAKILGANYRIEDESFELLKKVEAAAPQIGTAKFLLGMGHMQRGEPGEAEQIWKKAIDGARGDEVWYETVKQNLATLSAESGIRESLTDEQMQQVNSMVEGLASRLSEERGEMADWERLVRSYMVLGRKADAQAARDRAVQHFSEDAFAAKLDRMINSVEADQ